MALKRDNIQQTKEKVQSAKLAANEELSNANVVTPNFNTANDASMISVDKFTVTLSKGATKTGGKWVWTPSSWSEKNTFYYDVNYAISGTTSLKKGQFKVELPLHILKDRNGNWADTFECPFISDSEYQEGYDVDFIYSVDEENNKVTISNIAELSSGLTGVIEITYKSTEYTDEYKDMAAQNQQKASLIIESEDGSSVLAQKDIIEDAVYIDTNAAISSVSKSANSSSYYETWQDSWGSKPANADNYYYVIWSVSTYFEPSTQAYDIKIEDTFSDMGGSIVGYKMSGASEFTLTNSQTGCYPHSTINTSNDRTDYVLTRFSKSQADTAYNKGSYSISNKVKVTVTPAEKLDKTTTGSATGKFTRTKPVPPTYKYYGLGSPYIECLNWHNNSDKRCGYSTYYTLGDIKDGNLEILDGNYSHSFCYHANALVWDNVKGTEDDAKNGRFGHTNNDYLMKTNGFYLKADDGSAESLNSDDYDITSVKLSVGSRQVSYDSEIKSFNESSVSYTDTDLVTVKVYYNGAYRDAAVYNLKSKEFTSVDENYITEASGGELTFVQGVKNVKLEWTNPYCRTVATLTPHIKLYETEHVQGIINKASERLSVSWSAYGNINNGERISRGGRLFDRVIFAHGHGKTYINDKKVFYNPSISKSVNQVVNDKVKRSFKLKWSFRFSNEHWNLLSGRDKGTIEQSSGTFYDLLPAGAVLDLESVVVSADSKALNKGSYTLTMNENYKNTGRTMLVFKITEPSKNGYSISYQTYYSYESTQDYGKSLLNSVAYETGNDSLLNGYADTGGKLTESALMSGLDPDSSGNKFLYAEARTNVEALFYQYNGLKKQVKAQNDSDYSYDTTAYAGNSYSYKIRSANNKTNKSKNMIFFDSLESFYQSDTQTEEILKSDFKGTLKSIDVSQLRAMGVDPVIYLSKIEGLNVAAHHDLSETIDGEAVWIKYDEFVAKYGLEKARAVVVDARKATDGSDFVLDTSQGLTIILNMTAPKAAEIESTDPCAYNNVFLSLDLMQKDGDDWTTQSQFVHHDYTTLHLRVVGDVSLKKVDKTDRVTPVYGATYLLRGISDYNTEYSEVRVTAQNGSFLFEDIEKGTYELVETACSDDWQLDKNTYTVKIDVLGNATIEGMEKNDDGQYLAQDEPRIHTDICFAKADSITKNLFNGAEFILSGTSDYGNEILMQAASEGEDDAGGEAGEVFFENVELGTYTLSETKTKDGYILSKDTWIVRVTQDAEFFIYDDNYAELERGSDSYYLIPNEPLHSFRFVKSSTYGENIFLEGAKFSLTGISDYGTDTEKTAVSDADGIVTFNGLEPGTYQLKETEAPDKHDINKSVYEVTVKSDGSFEIEGLEKTEISGVELYDFKDVKTEGVIKLTKIWKDDKTNDERESPVLTISTKRPSKNPNGFTITFDANGGTFTSASATSTTSNDMVYSSSGTLISGTYIKPESEEGDFLNWTCEDGSEFALNEDGSPSATLTEDVTVYANYQQTGSMKYAVAIYGIEADTLEDGSTAGLTFGPAFGGRYATSYVSHTPSGTTVSGNAKRCVHNDSWSTIISWNRKDPYVYEDCIAAGCTHAVVLSKNTTTTILSETFDGSAITGDGPSTLYYELVTNAGSCYENLRWHPVNGNGSNSGGWGTTRIRAMLNGADSLTDTAASGISSDVNQYASVYTSSNCLLATFPNELRNAIGARAVKYDSVYNSKTAANLKTSYDKLWLFSPNELGDSCSASWANHPLEGSVYAKYEGSGNVYIGNSMRVPYYISSSAGGTSISSDWAWLRSSDGSSTGNALRICRAGYVDYCYAYGRSGVSVGFSLKR